MFVFESCVFILFLGGCCVWSLLRDGIRERQDLRRAERISSMVITLVGKQVLAIEEQFGPPFESIEGRFGRSLYVWKAPPARGLPKFRGTLVLTLTADAAGTVTEAVWRKQ